MSNPDQQQYFTRVTAGLEQVAWQDIARRVGARLIGFGHRRIDVAYAGPPGALLDLRSVDDVYVYVARLDGLDHTRASLARLSQKISQVDFMPALAICGSVRPIGTAPTYRVTASHLGRRNYSRYDVEGAVEAGLSAILPWRFVLNDPEEDEPELDLRVLLEADWALIGMRLGATPLHRRAYKVASRPGSLKAPVAYCLCLLAGLAPDDSLLDPACGAGTILVEAAPLLKSGVIVGGDIDEAALETAHTNLDAVGLHASAVVLNPDFGFTPTGYPVLDFGLPGLIQNPKSGALGRIQNGELLNQTQPAILIYHGDATDLPLADGVVRAVVTNPPWGQQVPAEIDLARLYQGMLRTIERVLIPGGRAVLLTDQSERLLAALAACLELRLVSSSQISLFGRHPTIYVIDKSNNEG